MVEHKLHNLVYLRENLSGAWNWCGVAQSEDTGRQAAKRGEWVFLKGQRSPRESQTTAVTVGHKIHGGKKMTGLLQIFGYSDFENAFWHRILIWLS